MANGLTVDDTSVYSDVFLRDLQLGSTQLVSVSSSGTPGNWHSEGAFVSDDGRFVAFASFADNFVSGDTNSQSDVFVRDMLTGQTTRVSVRSDGAEGDGESYACGISGDGRWTVYYSSSSNLVPADTNGVQDVFVYDRVLSQTVRASLSSFGGEGDGWSAFSAISADGRWVAFESVASNLVPGDTNAFVDVFLKDMQSGLLTRVSVGPGGAQGDAESEFPSISANGRYVSFESAASNLVPGDDASTFDIVVFDRITGVSALASASPSGLHGPGVAFAETGNPVSADGRFVTFATANALEPGDTNGTYDIYVRDFVANTLSRVSYSWTGQQAEHNVFWGASSGDASIVAFVTDDATLIPGDTNFGNDVFVRACPFPSIPVYASTCIGTSVDCPCSNAGNGVGGCENSLLTGGAELAAHGSASISADTLRLSAWRIPDGVATMFFQAPAATTRTPYGDGLLCLGGSTSRLGLRYSYGGAAQLGFGLPGDPPLSLLSNLSPTGGTRSYQLIYRDAAAFCPPGTFNLSNAINVVWNP
jgi:Tol biopolymer transport system component